MILRIQELVIEACSDTRQLLLGESESQKWSSRPRGTPGLGEGGAAEATSMCSVAGALMGETTSMWVSPRAIPKQPESWGWKDGMGFAVLAK